jgi:DNA-directed RNA polymerase specialized sigma24 family protein
LHGKKSRFRLQQGDVAAFAELVSRHEKRLWIFLRRFVADSATAEDLLQDVSLRTARCTTYRQQ